MKPRCLPITLRQGVGITTLVLYSTCVLSQDALRPAPMPHSSATGRSFDTPPAAHAPESILPFPVHDTAARASGFPSPAETAIIPGIHLHRELVRNPVATFFLRVSGNGLLEDGVHHGDLLVVDRSLAPIHGQLVVMVHGNRFVLRRLPWLGEDDSCYEAVVESEAVWGVATTVIHTL